MSLEVGEIIGDSDGSYLLNKFALGEWGEDSAGSLVGKDVSAGGWGIDMLMVLEGFPWVGWARLMGPGGGFTFFLGRLGEWQSEHLDLMSIAILIQGCGSHRGVSF